MKTTSYFLLLLFLFGGLLQSCGNTSTEANLELDEKKALEVTINQSAKAEEMETIEKMELNEEETKEVKLEVEKAQKAIEESIIKSPFAVYASDPDALIAHLNDKYRSAKEDCSQCDQVTQYFSTVGDDNFVKGLMSNDSLKVKQRIYSLFGQLKAVRDSCKNL